jgi:hypothetical protein
MPKGSKGSWLSLTTYTGPKISRMCSVRSASISERKENSSCGCRVSSGEGGGESEVVDGVEGVRPRRGFENRNRDVLVDF